MSMSQVAFLNKIVNITEMFHVDTVDKAGITQFFHVSAKISRILEARGHSHFVLMHMHNNQ
jgi:hypothetical protein